MAAIARAAANAEKKTGVPPRCRTAARISATRSMAAVSSRWMMAAEFSEMFLRIRHRVSLVQADLKVRNYFSLGSPHVFTSWNDLQECSGSSDAFRICQSLWRPDFVETVRNLERGELAGHEQILVDPREVERLAVDVRRE